jgi:hypothetical protein
LEQRRPPVMHRPEGETFDGFLARFFAAIDGVADDRISCVMGPWLAALQHDELRTLAHELQAVGDRQAGAERI